MPELAARASLLEGADHRLAAFHLHRDHLGSPGPDPTESLHFIERLPHAGQTDAASGRVKNRVRQLPAHLLSQFVAHSFFAFDAVRLFERGDIEPALARRAGGNQLRAIAD